MPLRHHSLIAWQRADDLFVRVHRLARQHFPREEMFALTSQLRRAAYSVPANIVEGFARESTRERLHFLTISAASLAEVGYCLHAARRLGYIDDKLYAEVDLEIRRTSSPLAGLIQQHRRQCRGTKDFG
ncbi:MAG: four helix bundle protein [Bacteroidales bacterium]